MILGLDISTSITGLTLLNNDGSFLESSYIDLRKIDEQHKKAECVKEYFLNTLEKEALFKIDSIFIEDKLSGFSSGKTKQSTLMKLGAINGIISWIIYESTSVDPKYIHPSTVKAIMKKEGLIIPKGEDKKKLTLEFARNKVPSFPYAETRNGNPQTYCYDMADSFIVARAGYIKFLCTKKKS